MSHMSKVTLSLEYCYGIKKLDTEFDFSTTSVYAIYAPNGCMKSSFAKVFDDIAKGEKSCDRIFPNRTTNRSVLDEAGAEVAQENVVSIAPYDEVYGHTEKTSTLLVDSKLRKEYEELHRDIDAVEARLLDGLKKQASTRKNVAQEISSTFTSGPDDFFTAVNRIAEEIAEQKHAPFADVNYDIVFDDKVVEFLAKSDFQTAIAEYVDKYNELLDKSIYFKRGIFNYYNAETIAKNLEDNGFFEAHHSVNLNANEITEVRTREQLEELINAEKDAISEDDELKKKFAEIDKLLNKNVTLRSFRTYIQDRRELVAHLTNMKRFREDVWKSYIVKHRELYDDLLSRIQSAKKRKAEIEEIAKSQKTQWESVIEIFNKRFFVPFRLVAKNREAVMLGYEPLLKLGFVFEDGDDQAELERSDLLLSLSTGEKKALYILNIIFEVEVRKTENTPTLFVVDDIADSFDYKNKYAIVEYLREIAEQNIFRQIILTHNFDFFRTINGRFVPYSSCLMAFKSDTGTTISQATGIKNVFANDWKNGFYTDSIKKVACIPFMRNVVEYTKGTDNDDFKLLTSLLHWKDGTDKIAIADLNGVFDQLFGGQGEQSDRPVCDLIREAAEQCMGADEGPSLENKVVLSIATRLQAERYMIKEIADEKFVAGIASNQTVKLFTRYQQQFPAKEVEIDVLQRVVLMTPESIHLNSFMYEPILDMSDNHLRKLHADVSSLQ